MIPQPQLSLTPASAALIASSSAWPVALTRNLVRELDRLNELTVGHIIEARATGAGPFPVSEGKLGVISSRYRRAVRPSKAALSGSAITSAIGNNVRYAGAHEYGFTGTVQVKAHRAKNAMVDVLQTSSGERVERWESFGLRGKKKKIASGYVQVKAHAMRMHLPERAPIRRGIADELPKYTDGLSAAIVATFSSQGSS